MREVMFELLSYEPFEQYEDPERDFIRSVLGVNPNYAGNPYYEDLFNGFYNNRGSSSLDWLATWVKQYYNGQDYPVLLKKICYYYMVKHKCNSEHIANALGITPKSASELLKQWNLYIDYRRMAETCKEINVPFKRRGKKVPYLIEFIQKTYYESLRNRVDKPNKKDLPVFVDIFGGTGVVASSMNVKSSYKIVNDFDEVMISTLYAFVYYPEVFIEKFKRFNLDIINGYYERLIPNIPKNEFTQGVSPRGSLVYYTDADLKNQLKEEVQKGASDDKLQLLKLIRNAWFYSQYALLATSNSAKQIRDLSNMHFYDKNNPHTPEVRDKICEIACYFVYYYHPGGGLPSGEPDFRQYNEKEHYKLLKDYFNIPDMQPQSRSQQHLQQASDAMVDYFLHLKDLKIKKDFLKDWRKGLKDAVIGKKSFEEIFPANVEQKVKEVGVEVSNMADRTFYYLDSPYFLTKDYAIDFNDEMHKIMLDNLRGSDFDWMFSIQYKHPCTKNTTKDSDIKKIYNYGKYYYGFVAEYEEEPNELGYYVSTYDHDKFDELDKSKRYRDLYVVLQKPKNENKRIEDDEDIDGKKKTEPRVEIFITTVDMRRYTPYGGQFIQISMKKFLEYVTAVIDKNNGKEDNPTLKEYKKYNPYGVDFFAEKNHYFSVYNFAKTEYEKELTP